MALTILLCTYNGGAALQPQLESYLAQDSRDWALWVSDDGSTDGTRERLQAFRRAHGQAHEIRLLDGPGQGAAANFLSLLCHPDLPPGMVAISDQDDVWLPHKLARARAELARAEAQTPGQALLYGAQSLHVDNALRVIGHSRTRGARPSFHNALVQNVISGHSAVLNPAALALVRRAGVPAGVPFHDWWLYMLITGAGGRAIVDDETVLLYRQHGENVMGAHEGLRARLERLRLVAGRGYGAWIEANLRALSHQAGLLSPEARRVLLALRLSRSRRGLRRIALLRKLGIHRQSRFGTACLYIAGLYGRA